MVEEQAKIRAINREKWAQRSKTMYNITIKPAGWLLGKAWDATKAVGKTIGKGVDAQIERSVRSYLYQKLDPTAAYTPQERPEYQAFPARQMQNTDQLSLFKNEEEPRKGIKAGIGYATKVGKTIGSNILTWTGYCIGEARRKMRHARAMAANYGQLENIAAQFTERGVPMTPREAYAAVQHTANRCQRVD